jgi:hypothetical protein
MPRWIDDLLGYNQILADDGTPARRRHILKFVGATVVDDGEATVVTTSGATTQAEYFLGATEPALPNHRLPVESSTIGWNLATPNTFVAFVKPGSVAGSVQFREEGIDVAQRAALNALDTPSITLSFADDLVNEEVELTAVRAALTGAVTAPAGDNATSFGAGASLSVLANATNASAVPDYLQASGAREHLRVNAAGTALEWGVLQLADFPVIASDTFLANIGISPAAPTAVTFDSVTGIGLEWDGTANEFNVTEVPLSALGPIAANTIVANATGSTASPTALAINSESVFGRTSGNLTNIGSGAHTALIRSSGSLFFASAAADQVLRRSGSGDLGFGTLVTNNIGNDQVTAAKLFNLAGLSVLGRATNSSGDMAAITATAAKQVLRLNDAGTSLEWGFATDLVDEITGLSMGKFHSIRFHGGTHTDAVVGIPGGVFGDDTAVVLYSVDVASLLAAIDSTSIVVSSSTLQRAAVTGAVSIAQNANTSQFSGVAENAVLQGAARDRLNFDSSSTIQAALTESTGPPSLVTMTHSVVAGSIGPSEQATMSQSRIKGRAEGAGTGAEQDLTPAQVVAIIDAENAAWTGSHAWTGNVFNVGVTNLDLVGTNDVTLAAIGGGLALEAGYASPTVSPSISNGDVVVSGASGVGIHYGATQVTAVTGRVQVTSDADIFISSDLDLELNGQSGTVLSATSTPISFVSAGHLILQAENEFRIFTGSGAGTERLNIPSSGAWLLGGDPGSSGDVMVSQGGSAPPLWQGIRLSSVFSANLAGDTHNLNIGSANRLLLTPTVANPELTGFVGSGVPDGTLVWLHNVSTTNSITLVNESTSSVSNRLQMGGTGAIVPPRGSALFIRETVVYSRWLLLNVADF